MKNFIKFGAGVGVVLGLIFLTWFFGTVNVNRGRVGVKTTWGAVVDSELQPGMHFRIPVMSGITEISVQKETAVASCHGASKDLQQVDTDVNLLYTINPSLVCEAYNKVGDRDDIENKIIQPAINETFKAVNARYTAEELITKRAEVSLEVQEELEAFISRSCKDAGLEGLVLLSNMAIEDFRFSPEFNNAIEAKVTAEQEALRAEEEKNRTITQAEAKKEEVRLASEAQALQIENEAKAEATKIELQSIARAEAIEREALAIKSNPELLTLRQIETWDGKLPVYMMGNGSDSNVLLSLPSAGASK